MRRPGILAIFVIFTFIIATFVLLDPILHAPIPITLKGTEETIVMGSNGQPLNTELENLSVPPASVLPVSVKPSNAKPTTAKAKEDIKIDFHVSQLNSSLPSLRELYPGGFDSPGVPACLGYEDELQLLIVVHSAPTHVDRRRAIRTSWASPDELPAGVRVVFLIGEGGDRDPSKEPIEDVIVARFIDTYRNLTLKSVAMLDWTVRNCPNAQFLLKCDDDVYVNVLKLVIELEMDFQRKNTIIGRIAYAWKPIRNEKSKYYMSFDEFAPSVLPNFTTGPAYVVEGGAIGPLLHAALAEPWLSLEDVFITGLVGGARMGANLVHWPAFLNNRATMTVCNAQRLIAIHNVKPKEQLKLVKLSKFSGRSCKIRDLRTKNEKGKGT